MIGDHGRPRTQPRDTFFSLLRRGPQTVPVWGEKKGGALEGAQTPPGKVANTMLAGRGLKGLLRFYGKFSSGHEVRKKQQKGRGGWGEGVAGHESKQNLLFPPPPSCKHHAPETERSPPPPPDLRRNALYVRSFIIKFISFFHPCMLSLIHAFVLSLCPSFFTHLSLSFFPFYFLLFFLN